MQLFNFACVLHSFGSKHVTPRTLTSQFLGNMVCVEGIVTKSTLRYLLRSQLLINVILYFKFYLTPFHFLG